MSKAFVTDMQTDRQTDRQSDPYVLPFSSKWRHKNDHGGVELALLPLCKTQQIFLIPRYNNKRDSHS